MDIFTWSIPFVAEKITEMLYYVIKAETGDDNSDDELDENDMQRLNNLISK